MNPNEDLSDGGGKTVPYGADVQTVPLGGPNGAVSSGGRLHRDKLLLGTRLGEFEITALVGEGGFSIVYLAWDHSLARRVALKEYFPASLAMRMDDSWVDARSTRYRETFEVGLRSFVNEGKLLAQFDHPALVKVYRFWEANGTAYMVMPFYKGTTLSETVRAMKQPPDEAWLLALLGPLTEALLVIHAVQCVHRDIAPDNVLLLPSSKPLLLDFGAARHVITDRTQALTVMIKPGYAPIEQYADDNAIKQGPWTDVYALAAVVYWAITGKTPPAAVGRMLNDAFVPLALCAAGRYGDGFLQAVDRALALLPEHRTQSIEQFRRELGLDCKGSEELQRTVVRVDPEQPALSATSAGADTQAPSPVASEPEPEPERKPNAATTVAPARTAGPSGRGQATFAATAVLVMALGAAVWWWSRPLPRDAVALSSLPVSAAPLTRIEQPTRLAPALTTASAFDLLLADRDVSFELTASAVTGGSAAMQRIRFQAAKDGHVYLIAQSATSQGLRLLYPAPNIAAREPRGDGHVDVPTASIGPDERVVMILSRSRRELDAVGWTARQGILSRNVDSTRVTTTSADAVLGSVICAGPSARCDSSFGMVEVVLVTEMTAALSKGPSRIDPFSVRAPAPTNNSRAASIQSFSDVSTERKPVSKRDPAQAVDCARILQRMSLGEAGAELIERMKTLSCN